MATAGQQRPGRGGAGPRGRSGLTGYGVVTEGLLVVDIDAHRGGEETWASLVVGRPALPETLTVTTPRGGRHLYFALPEGVAVAPGADRLGPGVDVKSGPGAYVVGPGSRIAAEGTGR